jgi:XTP/dITP diphosphohydrolase
MAATNIMMQKYEKARNAYFCPKTCRMREELAAFERLLTIMDELRAGCPWDSAQTFESLRHLTIEETYELSDAILEKNPADICGELGDLMLHLVFYAKIGSETRDFSITEVLHRICDKLVRRHPHIYGDVVVANADEVKTNWEHIKLKSGSEGVLSGVPLSLPAMVKAYRIQEKVRGVGFDWEHPSQVREKVIEEWNELQQEVNENAPHEKTENEFGDLLFALINYARFIGVNPEDALEKTNKKFMKRFKFLESKARETGRNLQDMTLGEMDKWWEEAKETEK